ncbi:hypothetical protein FRC11_000485, partial [Ceratobasidium sp. 423]
LDMESSNQNGNTDVIPSSNGDHETSVGGNETGYSSAGATTGLNVGSLRSVNQQTNDPSNMGVGPPEPERPEITNGNRRAEEQPPANEPQPVVTPLLQMGPTHQSGSRTLVGPGTLDSAHNSNSSTPASNFATPRRPARSVGLTTPTIVVFATPPPWARFDAKQGAHFSSLPPTTIPPFNWPSARIEDVGSNTPLGDNPLSSLSNQSQCVRTANSTETTSDVFSETPTSRSDCNFGSNSLESQATVPREVSTGSATQVQSSALTIRSSTPNISRMYNTIMQTLPPPPLAQSSTPHSPNTAMVQVSNSSANRIGSVTAPGTVSRSSSVSRISGPHSRAGSVTRTSSLALDNRSFREDSMTRDSVAPVTNASGSHSQAQPLRSLRQRDFQYDQVVFMKAMSKRWHWFLIADDLFPIHTNAALELCTEYAEQSLEVSRVDCNITYVEHGFVRRKDSAIRNLFQTGLLSIVEEAYEVNPNTTEKLSQLISQSNYIYAEYDIT